MDIPKKAPEEQKYMYFSITAEVSYVDEVPPEGQLPVYKREKTSMLYAGTSEGIRGAELQRITTNFEILFHNEYAQTLATITKTVPQVTKIVILSICALGYFTQAEFGQGIKLPLPPEAEPEKKG